MKSVVPGDADKRPDSYLGIGVGVGSFHFSGDLRPIFPENFSDP